MYVPLYCKSHFSFLEGAAAPEELVERAHGLGLPALALTDRHGLYGAVRAHRRARELGLPLVLGAELWVDDGSPLVLLAADRRGYANLCQLISAGQLRSAKGQCRVSWTEVAHRAAGLIALWGGRESLLAREPEPPRGLIASLREAFSDRLYALLTRQRRADEVAPEARLRERARRAGLPLAAAVEVLYPTPARRPLQDVLTCIRHGLVLAQAGRRILPNDEHDLKDPRAFHRLFADTPAARARSLEIAARCHFSLAELRYRYPSERLPDGKTSGAWLRELSEAGARRRFGGRVPASVREQLGRELALIEELDVCGYFLTMWEIVDFCRRHGILCQGRGSAANSTVCYCLGITAVDPTRSDLLFERFLSRERGTPPDIDLDIMHERREEVIQHVYARYGRERAAMVANVIRYRARSAVREVGRVLGISATALDRLATLLDSHGEVKAEQLRRAGLDPQHPAAAHLLRLSGEIRGVPRHLSIHPGGFLLGQGPVNEVVPIENAARQGRTVIQWDKEDLEELRLFKVDLLGLGALSQLDRSLALIRRHYGRELSLATLPAEDPATFAMLTRADTVGVFQIESRAQMAMLPRLRPRSYYDLVIEVAIVRPGPIRGGMVHPYLRRRRGEEPITYPHPRLEPVLARTLGVPLFQEQVMRLAVVAADYTPGESDQLRRDMAAWRRSGRIERHRDRLLQRMQAKGIRAEFAERVFEQIRGFGEYGFPESHAASFALLAYATAWIKCHYPAVFTCALLNAQPMGFYSPATLVEDAKRHGVAVRPASVQSSDWDARLEPDPAGSASSPGSASSAGSAGGGFALRLGLRGIQGLSQRRDFAPIEEARRRGRFRSLEDFVRRCQLDRGTLTRLAAAGALADLEPSRRRALWAVRGATHRPRRGSTAPALPWIDREARPRFPALRPAEAIAWDYRHSGMSPRGHPLAALRGQLRARGFPTAREMASLPDGARARYAGAVICRQRPATASGTIFLTLEDETGFLNAVVWKSVSARAQTPLVTASLLALDGTVQNQDGVVHLIADRLWIPQLESPPPERIASRDFR